MRGTRHTFLLVLMSKRTPVSLSLLNLLLLFPVKSSDGRRRRKTSRQNFLSDLLVQEEDRVRDRTYF